MGTKQFDNYADLITFTRASGGTALRPISYGSELVTNGTFDTDVSGWSASGANLSVSSGQLLVENPAGGSAVGWAAQFISTVAGKVYRFEGDYIGSSGRARIQVNDTNEFGTNLALLSQTSSSGTFVSTFVALSSVTLVRLVSFDDGGVSTFDNVSVKEVLFDQPNAPLTLFNHPTNIPRIEYDANGNRLGLLVEEQRTNLLLRSEEFDNSYWLKTNAAVTSNQAVAPDGTLTGDKLVENTSSGLHAVSKLGIILSGSSSWSFYAKAGERTRVMLDTYNGTSGSYHVFDLASGTIVQNQSGTATITHVGNGWYRCAANRTAGSNSQYALYLVNTGTSISYTGDGTSGIYLWGAQLEAGAFPTSYIPTSGSTATRAADVASIPTSAFGYNASEGTVVVTGQIASTGSATRRLASINDGTVDNSIQAAIASAGTVSYLEVRFNFAIQAAFTNGSFAVGGEVKTGIAYKVDDFALSANGASPTTDTAGLVPAVDRLNIGTHAAGASPINGHIKSIKYYPRRLSNAQLVELTQ